MHYVGLRYIRYALIHGRQSLAEIIFIGFKKVNFIMTLATEGHVFSCNLKKNRFLWFIATWSILTWSNH